MLFRSYPSYEDAIRVDRAMLGAIRDLDFNRMSYVRTRFLKDNIPGLSCLLCNWQGVRLGMRLSVLTGADNVELLPYANSGDSDRGDRQKVVGYGAACFYSNELEENGEKAMDEIDFSAEEKKLLFTIARESIRSGLNDEKRPDFSIEEGHLTLKRGVFVTLTNRGELRGCIGNFTGSYPLWEMVARMAESAALRDYRFSYNPITLEELPSIDIKISILSEMKKVESADEIEVGVHGVWIRKNSRSGTFLPEVAAEMGWDKEEMLTHLCAEKAGLAPDAWKKDAEMYIYTSQILEEGKGE